MAAPLPDHYRTLGVAPAAAADAIKAAYRTLARRYHPDAAPDNPHAAAQFRAVQEAYTVLAHPGRRQRYDEARWLAGLQGGTKAEAVTGATLLRDAKRLRLHVDAVGRGRVSPGAVQRVALFLLDDAHLAVLAAEGDTAQNTQLADEILQACAGLKGPLLEAVVHQLRLVPTEPGFADRLQEAWKRQQAARREAAWQPVWMLLLTAVLCALLWALAHR